MNRSAWGVILFVLLGCGIVAALDVAANNGRFFYTLDDPYIHLDLAETLWRTGVYGVNPDGAPAAPSSSIIWPFLLAGFGAFEGQILMPFVLNLLCMVGSALTLLRLLGRILPRWRANASDWLPAGLSVLAVYALNLPGLAFMGLEQNMQIWLTLLVAEGLIATAEGRRPGLLLWLALMAGPLVRYENLAVTLAALPFLCLRRHARPALAATLVAVALVAGFSLYLMSLGLAPLPSSIMVKKSVGGNFFLSTLFDIISNFRFYVTYGTLAIILFISFWLLHKRNALRQADWQLLMIANTVLIAQFAFGKFGPMFTGRYEIYALAFAGVLIAYAAAPPLRGLWKNAAGKGVIVALLLVLFGLNFRNSTYDPPGWSHAIYAQQGQMHDFAVNVWKGPVAVNDIGVIGYRNPHEVLDLFGLSSAEAREAQWRGEPGWMDRLVRDNHIDVAMIYPKWFERTELRPWYPLAILARPRGLTDLGLDNVVIYATNAAAVKPLARALNEWSPRLPPDARLVLLPAPAVD